VRNPTYLLLRKGQYLSHPDNTIHFHPLMIPSCNFVEREGKLFILENYFGPKFPIFCVTHWSPSIPQTVILRCNIIKLTKLSSLLATIDANRRSPARSEIRKMYSGAFTWLLRWVRPAITGAWLKDVVKCPVLWDVTLCCLVCGMVFGMWRCVVWCVGWCLVCGMWRCVVWCVVPDILKDHSAFIF